MYAEVRRRETPRRFFWVFGSLALRSLRRRLREGGALRLGVVTQALLFALLAATCVFAELPLFSALSLEARSAPLMVALVSAFLISYLHAFELRRRARELSVYDTLGMGALRCAGLYLLEQVLAGLLCLGLGLFLALPLVWLMLVLLAAAVGTEALMLVEGGALLLALWETLAYFAGIFFASLVYQTAKLCRGTVTGRFLIARRNETPLSRKSCRRQLCVSAICFLAALGMLLLAALDSGTASFMVCSALLAPALLLGIFSCYSGGYSLLCRCRSEAPRLFYKGARLFQAGALLSQCRKNARLSAVVCICFLTALVSCVMGTLCLSRGHALEELVMGGAQMVICILFLTAAMVILGVQGRAEAWERAGQLPLLSRLGMEGRTLSRLGWFFLASRFAAPLVLLAPLTMIGVPLVWRRLDSQGAALAGGLLFYFGILAALFLLYAVSSKERVLGQGGGPDVL